LALKPNAGWSDRRAKDVLLISECIWPDIPDELPVVGQLASTRLIVAPLMASDSGLAPANGQYSRVLKIAAFSFPCVAALKESASPVSSALLRACAESK
jgi:hypothetical protein